MPPTGYSGTPLPKKLGFKHDTRLVVLGAPDDYDALVSPLPAGLQRQRSVSETTTLVHVFVTRRDDLARHLGTLRAQLSPDAAVWVSWPKKSSRVATDITEDTIRDEALRLGWVDIKVCAVSDVWSGLKLTVRKELRPRPSSRVTSFAPQFLVDDLDRSIAYYRKIGFEFGKPWDGFYAIGHLDGLELHLKEAASNREERRWRRDNEHLDAAAGVDGIEAFYHRCVANGVTVIRPLAATAWGTKDFYVEDPDGYIICFGGRPLER